MAVKTGCRTLGGYGNVASWASGNGYPKMTILCSSGVDEGAFYPAQSVDIVGKRALLDLRAAIDDALAEETFNELKK